MSDYDYITIEPTNHVMFHGFSVYGHGTYDANSVLAGQHRRVFLDSFKTREEAIAAWPLAENINHSTRSLEADGRRGDLAELSGLPETPPDWFDPLDAGEEW